MHEQFDDLLTELVAKATVGQEVLGEVLARTSLRSPGPTTRAEIAEGNPAALRAVDQRPIPQGTVSKAVKALTSVGLLEEKGIKTTDARWRGELYLGETWVSAGVHIDRHQAHPTGVTTVIKHLDGTQACPPDYRQVDNWAEIPATVLNQIADLAPDLVHHEGCDGAVARPTTTDRRLFGIGVEVAAPIEHGVVRALAGDTVDLGTLFREQLSSDTRFGSGLPVVIENDVDALAVHATYESHFAVPDLAVVSVFDDGVGGGLVLNGQLRRGPGGRSMEIGHLSVGTAPGEISSPDQLPARCRCGGYGHVSAIAPPARIRDKLGIADLRNATGDDAIEVIKTAGATLGRAISHICNVVNPSGLILYLPAELAASSPSTTSIYLESAYAQIRECFNAPAWVPDVRVWDDNHHRPEILGAEAAATCVLQSFIEHALRLDGCQDAQDNIDMRKYMAKTHTGAVNVRHFDKPMTHALEVDGQIWAFYESREAAESGALVRGKQGHSVAVVEAAPYIPERSFDKLNVPNDQLNRPRARTTH